MSAGDLADLRAPSITGHSAEHTFELDPDDQVDAIELRAWDKNRRSAEQETFRVAYITIKLADGRPWYVSASGPRFDPVSGLPLPGGYVRDEWHGYPAVPAEIRAVIEQHIEVKLSPAETEPK